MTADPTPRVTHVPLQSGIRLHCTEYGHPEGDPVVFLHGWPDSWFTFSRVLPLLPPSMRAIAVDQRGFGESDRPAAGYAIPDFAADVVGLLDALELARVTLVGHSFGSFVARQAAIAQPDRVGALALIGTGLVAATRELREVQTALRDLPDPIPVEFAREFQAGTAFRPLPPEFFERVVAESLKLPPRLWQLTLDGLIAHDDTPHLHHITAPALLVWGDRDALFPRVDQDRVIASLRSARLLVYGDTGHCPNWEAPERLAADLAAFVLG